MGAVSLTALPARAKATALGTAYSYTQSNGNGERTSSQATAEPGLGQVVSSFVYQAGTFVGPLASSPECRS
jgi:hypothetical protein